MFFCLDDKVKSLLKCKHGYVLLVGSGPRINSTKKIS